MSLRLKVFPPSICMYFNINSHYSKVICTTEIKYSTCVNDRVAIIIVHVGIFFLININVRTAKCTFLNDNHLNYPNGIGVFDIIVPFNVMRNVDRFLFKNLG